MPQFQPEVPDPLTHDAPYLLPVRCVAAPSVRVLLIIFIREQRLERPTVQIQFDHIAGGKCLLREVGKEQFVDDACPRDSNGTFLLGGRMGSHDHAAQHARWPHWDLGTIVETSYHLTFRTLLELIMWQMQPSLNQRMIKHVVLTTASHKGKSGQIREYRTQAIEPIKLQEGVFRWTLACREIPVNDRQALAQFHPVLPVASVAETAELCGIDPRYLEKGRRIEGQFHIIVDKWQLFSIPLIINH
jgi:nitrogen fixation protein